MPTRTVTLVDPLDESEVDRITQIDLNHEMQRSYLDYAMSVIVSRALPDVRDGLKPVHRRIVYAMFDGGYRPDRSFSKSAKVVGEVMGNYHPHGDSAIYDAMVRLVQPWSMRYPLILGQGNFGSAGDDGAAAPRYTECKMAPLALELVRDIEQDTVDMQGNYDNTVDEPVVLPARFPNLLVNGSAGIAVGMATNIPPHNLREVAEAAQWLLTNYEATKPELLEACLRLIKGPDFPPAPPSWAPPGSRTPTAPGVAPSPSAPWSPPRRLTAGCRSWSPNFPTRSTPTPSRARSPRW